MIFFTSQSGKAHNPRSGFTLLLAALVAAIVLSLGASIFSIAKKQVTLSSLGRDSQFAFYAADTIAECALYYDVRQSATTGFTGFATSTLSATMNALTCDKVTVTPVLQSATANTAVSYFRVYTANGGPSGARQDGLFSLDEAGNPNTNGGNCAEVYIQKNATAPYTVIHADGYSTPCSTISSNSRTLQRSIELQY
jgi:hypothetical protein